MKFRRGVGIALLGAGLVVLSCSAQRGDAPVGVGADASASTASVEAAVESRVAAARVEELRARFRFPVRPPEDDRAGLAAPVKPAAATSRSALGAAVATRFEAAPDAATYVRAVLPADALRGVIRTARVALPVRADGEVKLEDDTSHVSVGFALEHVRNARIEVAGGMALYRGALDGADVVHRVHAEGTEDFVVFETRPGHEELGYSVDVSRVPGLRLVGNTLEFLDEGGTPVLRVAPPYVVDAIGARHEARLEVAGCAYDASPAGPWGRTVTKPGAQRCTVRVAWAGSIAYPAMVDPAWVATGSMAIARRFHTANLLPLGKVLVAGGIGAGDAYLASAELFDPAGGAGAGTFAATGPMVAARYSHTASSLLSGKVLVTGGYSGAAYLASAELYDASAGTFAITGSMAAARAGQTASSLLSGKVLVTGGYSGAAYLASAELFDPAGNAGAGTFAGTGSMGAARSTHTASVLSSGKVLVVGGRTGLPSLASAELFDPAGNAGGGTFVPTGSMATVRYFHTATVLPSGKALVVGGVGAGDALLSSAELYDPAANAGAGAFAATGSMATARDYHSASLLPSGKVLVAAGYNGAYVASAELYDPAGNAGTGTFAAAGSLATPRGTHTASVLPSGKVLVAGGHDGSSYLNSAELFGGAPGDGCLAGGNCFSGLCVDGFCCNTACSGGACDRCDLAGKEGTCSVAPLGNPGASPTCAQYACDGVSAACPTSCASDATCAAAYYCDPNGTCQPRKAQASACNTQSDCREPGCRECTSGFCVDGFCCDTACDGTCLACSAALKYTAAADGTCDSAMAGLNRGGKVCGPPGAKCDGDHTTTASDGTKKDCAPYKCESNATCRSDCTSVSDCVAPTICDSSGKCVPPQGAASDGGCALSSTRVDDDRSRLPWLGLASGLVLVRLRRRRRRVSSGGRGQ